MKKSNQKAFRKNREQIAKLSHDKIDELSIFILSRSKQMQLIYL